MRNLEISFGFLCGLKYVRTGPVGRFIYRGVFPYSGEMEFNPGTFQRNFKIWDASSFVVSIAIL